MQILGRWLLVRLFKVFLFSLFSFALIWIAFPVPGNAAANYGKILRGPSESFGDLPGLTKCSVISNDDVVPTPEDGGIREIIPVKFREKYQKWKDEMLAGTYGRQEWERYAANKKFILTITVSTGEKQGAGTGEYKWNDSGELVEATITLGSKLDSGFPNPIYFPVMNSLAGISGSYDVSGEILAAAKFAHEFGHVNSTFQASSKVFRLQNSLMPAYNKILLENGYQIRDQRLVDLAKQMGGTPVEIWENREYWGETNAMRFLLDRIKKEDFYCSVVNKIESNVRTYAAPYQQRFTEIEEGNDLARCRK